MNIEAVRRGLLDPDWERPRRAELLSKDAPPTGRSKATVQLRSAVDEIKP